MICRACPVAPSEWVDYAEDRLEANAQARLNLHLESCPKCRAAESRLLKSRKALETAAKSERHVSAGSVQRIWDGLRFRIRRPATGPAEQARWHLHLHRLLTELCGPETAQDVLQQAKKKAGDQSFPHYLGAYVEVLCGDCAAQSVRHAADRARERVA